VFELFLLLAAIVVVAALVSWFGRRERLAPVWARAAEDLGLPPPPRKGFLARPSLSGTVDGRRLRVRERADNESDWIDYELGVLHGLPSGLTIKTAHVGSRVPVVGTLLSGGRTHIETGDDRFDRSFVVVGDDPAEARDFLTDERRAVLVWLAQECPGFRLKNGELKYRFGGDTDQIENVARPAHAMIEAARVLAV
jgi:hypothetical protein